MKNDIPKPKSSIAGITVTAECLGCGQEVTKLLSWFKRHKFKCAICGTEFNKKPFQDLAKASVKNLLAMLQQRK